MGHAVAHSGSRFRPICMNNARVQNYRRAAAHGGSRFRRIARCTIHDFCATRLPTRQSVQFGHVTVSNGISSGVPGNDFQPDSMIKAADTALYRAKHGVDTAQLDAQPQVITQVSLHNI